MENGGGIKLSNTRAPQDAGHPAWLSREVEGGEGGDDALGFEGDGDDLADEAKDVFGVVGAVGVVDDAGAGVGGDAVLCWSPIGTHSRAERLPRR